MRICSLKSKLDYNKIAIKLAAFHSRQRKTISVLDIRGTASKISVKLMLSTIRYSPKIPKRKPKSPIRFTTNAFIAAAFADGFLK